MGKVYIAIDLKSFYASVECVDRHLDALKTNLPAQRMYEKAGFLYRGEQRLYAENTGVTDFLYYEKIPELDLFKEG